MKKFLASIVLGGTLLFSSINVHAEEVNREQIFEWFRQDNWENEDDTFRKAACLFLIQDLSKELMIDVPKVDFMDFENDLYGTTSMGSKVIRLNTDYIYSGSDMLDTCAHELRHIWQSVQMNADTEYGIIFKDAWSNYTKIEEDYDKYYENLIEADARGYADKIYYEFITNFSKDTILENTQY